MSIKEIQPGYRRNPQDNTGSSKVKKRTGRTYVNCSRFIILYYIILFMLYILITFLISI